MYGTEITKPAQTAAVEIAEIAFVDRQMIFDFIGNHARDKRSVELRFPARRPITLSAASSAMNWIDLFRFLRYFHFFCFQGLDKI